MANTQGNVNTSVHTVNEPVHSKAKPDRTAYFVTYGRREIEEGKSGEPAREPYQVRLEGKPQRVWTAIECRAYKV